MAAVIRYCEGRPERGARALTACERARIARRMRRLRWQAAGRLAAVLAAPLAPVVLAGWLRVNVPGGLGPLAGVVLVLGGLFLLFPVSLLWTRDALRAAHALARDLKAGAALQFGDAPAGLDLLPASGLVLAQGGAPGDLRRVGRLGEAAPPAADGPLYAMAVQGALREVAESGLMRRPLTTDERAELSAHAERLLRIPWLLAAGLFGSAFLGTRLSAFPDAPAAARALTLGVVLLVIGAALQRLLAMRTMGHRLEEDVEEGWALRVTRGPAAGDELLGASGLPWTVEGGPAAWRVDPPSVR